jgi:phage tail-like protein
MDTDQPAASSYLDYLPAIFRQTGATASHTYTQAGTYTVKVTVTDTANQASTATTQVTVTAPDAPPAAALTLNPASGLAPLAVTADASASSDTDATPIASYTFDFGDESAAVGPQTGATASHTYTQAGTFTVTVTVKDTADQASTATTQVTVTSAPDAPPAAALTVNPTSGTAPLAVTADASASSDTDATLIDTYTFDFGDGTTVGPQEPFVGRFLRAFETVLSGTDEEQPGLETTIGRVADYLDPMTTEAEFLPWLAGWVTLSLRADWDEATKKSFIQQIVPLYRLRGTRAGLERMLELYTGQLPDIDDDFGEPAHYFQVQLTLREADPEQLQRKQEIARAIIDQQKPAHTFYALQVAVPTMRLVSTARQQELKSPLLILGENTLLGTTTRSL